VDEERIDLKTSEDAGPHIGSKRLIAYRQGTLPEAEHEAVQEHLSLCRRCTGLLRELRAFEAAAAGEVAAGPEPLQQEAWESLVQRLPREAPAVRPAAADAKPRHVPYWIYGVAAALLLTVVALSVWAAATVRQERRRLARIERQLQEREEALAAAQRALAETERQLNAARGRIQGLEQERLASERDEQSPQPPLGRDRTVLASRIEVSITPRFALRDEERPENSLLRGGGAVNPVRLPPPAKRFTVSLSPPDHPADGEYRFELVNGGGEVLWASQWPANAILGDAGTSVSIRGLGPGRYRLRVASLNPDGSPTRFDEYLLQVEK